MLVGEARDFARVWVHQEAATLEGFRGANLSGSVTWLPEHAELPLGSDVDIHVYVAGEARSDRPSKFLYRGALLGVAYGSLDQLGTAEELLADFQKSGAFRGPTVIADPTGKLTELQQAVTKDFAKREWVEKRLEHARNHCLRYVGAQDAEPALPYPDAVGAWAFASGILTLIPLIAALRNPTVRLRYLRVRELLKEYDRLAFYETLLQPLGVGNLGRKQVARHMPALEAAYDAAGAAIRTPFFFAGDLNADSRVTAIDGSQDLIERGDYREAVFYMVATYARCQTVFAKDAPELHDRHDVGFQELLRDLGVASRDDLRARVSDVEALLPRVLEVAEEIMAATAEIRE